MKMEIVILGSHAIVKKKKKEVPTKVLWYAGRTSNTQYHSM